MSKNLGAFAIFVAFIVTGLLSTARAQSEYPTCAGMQLDGGELLYLSEVEHRRCWKRVGAEIDQRDLAVRGGSYSFVYIFGDSSLDEDFDPIFNVRSKAILRKGVADGGLGGSIKLFRSRIVTDAKCDGRALNIFRRKGVYDELQGEVSGVTHNGYHNGKISLPGSKLDSFHIYFRDSRGKCRRTDDGELRKLFAVSDVEYSDTTRLMAFFKSFVTFDGTATAKEKGNEKYSRVSVKIGQGRFRNGNYYSSFTLQSSGEYNVLVNDLSTYIGYHEKRRRRPVEFKIRRSDG